MLKVPTTDICIYSPNQNDYVNFVSSQNQKCHILGRGGYGCVYRAIYRDQPVAVKIIQKNNKESKKSATRESNILGWNHENIVNVLKVTPLENCFTIIMERFQGICLQQLINEIKLSLWHRVRILTDVANGLMFCHTKGLVHLDIKPKNIFVAFDGDNYKCKIFDFGCSSFTSKDSCKKIQCGTIRYMSPDILQGFNIGFHDDIYSFGITMWQLKSNVDPYNNIPSNEIVAYHVVKNRLRPDSKHDAINVNEKGNSDLMKCDVFTTNKSLNIKSAKQTELFQLLTPKNRKTMELTFLSTGHRKQTNLFPSTISCKSIRKLDFNLMSNKSSKNRDAPMVKHKLGNIDDILSNKKNMANLFKDNFQHLSNEKKIKMENLYQNIYKQCWEHEAAKRPSSEAVYAKHLL
ncbi:Serine/threonine-protein kinase-transforming protein mos [Pseudolycoriella hygida]|uniref:Serine/threonine-protein kinase-transforming protein mos n=1 Tax=Pseudolycoriella hygida TaxID=35572 RepID=A0A9Q0MTD7_9DIPT|nr:Serine/threonine-protein kinase-transforming protein mos [Pseudolycoriella hygida]